MRTIALSDPGSAYQVVYGQEKVVEIAELV
jgi:hypothetical protein